MEPAGREVKRASPRAKKSVVTAAAERRDATAARAAENAYRRARAVLAARYTAHKTDPSYVLSKLELYNVYNAGFVNTDKLAAAIRRLCEQPPAILSEQEIEAVLHALDFCEHCAAELDEVGRGLPLSQRAPEREQRQRAGASFA